MSKRGQVQSQIGRLTASNVLHGSESLCKLLRYLANQALENPGAHLKEYQIATEVFGRSPDFDPQSDSVIRVQAARLRGKLAEYYASEGADDLLIIELPRGSYSLQFHRKGSSGSGGTGISENAFRPKEEVRKWQIAAGALLALLVVFAISGIWLREHHPVQASMRPESPVVPRALRTFWWPFVNGSDEPLVIFSNAVFVGRPETGIRYFDPARDRRELAWDHYSGVGEVLAIHDLDQVFDELHQRTRVKRGSLFSLDDANNNNLIFVGSPSENLKLSALSSVQEFVFQRLQDGPRKGDLGIVNLHPHPGEAKVFLASPAGSPLTEDYAVVALMPGLDAHHSMMVLAGTTTFGTQGAVQFVCTENSVQTLLSRISDSSSEAPQPFEAVIRVKIALGVPVEMEIVAERLRPSSIVR